MNFDRVAASYRWLETVVFGDQLQRARVAFLGKIKEPRRVLVVGEGNGRFLAEFARHYPETSVDCIEGSARMIALARHAVGPSQVRFIEADIGAATLAQNSYDLIVTHFVLDCFSEETLPPLVGRLADAATTEAVWLIADFCYPAGRWRRWHARTLIGFMYFFFRVVTRIEARRLVDYRPWLSAQGFECVEELISPNEMISSKLWRRK